MEQYQTKTHCLVLGKAEMPTLDENEILVQTKAIGSELAQIKLEPNTQNILS
ncbi:hypothetical protein QWY77_05560 [Thalassotalea ponticola]|uniref:hypothetical protein n=1 Tax=Thalassotalea ponticola TaxID=1523392 RepID=UPI0025B306C6|nr:hypothetical protein [Thalassotalea ponticola]MDN3652230.1 hypothetical protein [Thalassotalea ponticola]